MVDSKVLSTQVREMLLLSSLVFSAPWTAPSSLKYLLWEWMSEWMNEYWIVTASFLRVEQAPGDTHIALGFQPSDYNKWKFTNSPTFLEVLEEFPSLRVSASFLLSQLPILKPYLFRCLPVNFLSIMNLHVHLTQRIISVFSCEVLSILLYSQRGEAIHHRGPIRQPSVIGYS